MTAIPDERWSELPLACVVWKAGALATTEALNEHLLAKGIAKWQLPDRYLTIGTVPPTSTGKFWKPRLRQMFPR